MAVELLAPARNLAAGRAALDAGADAVYIGPPAFGARARVGNSLEDIHLLAEAAHRVRARVYATLNTLLFDEELEVARKMAWDLWDAGVDALIVQDLGLLELDLPPIPLHASTQAHVDTAEKVRFFEEIGFSRVILPREMSVSEIAGLRDRTAMPLEVFVHGALCVSTSGQCWMSHFLGGRSGNRGTCAQPCRLPWRLETSEGKVLADSHLLSLKDLDRSSLLGDLLEAGVTSFKLEGRLKDETWVRNGVGFYRTLLDQALGARKLERSSQGVSRLGFTPDLRRTFNRGFTSYQLQGPPTPGALGSPPKSQGQPVGRVRALRGASFEVTGPPLVTGDGLCFVATDGVLRGTTVSAVEGGRVWVDDPTGLGEGMFLSRNRDIAFERTLKGARTRRVLPVEMGLGPGLRVWVRDPAEGHEVWLVVPDSGTIATHPDLAERQLRRTGESGWEIVSFSRDLPEVPHHPASVWNGLRRELLRRLDLMRALGWNREVRSPASTPAPFPEKHLSYAGNVTNRAAAAFYRRHGVVSIEPGAECGTHLAGRPLMTVRHCLRAAFRLCPRQGGVKAPELRLVRLDPASGKKQRFPLRFVCDRCEMLVLAPEEGAP